MNNIWLKYAIFRYLKNANESALLTEGKQIYYQRKFLIRNSNTKKVILNGRYLLWRSSLTYLQIFWTKENILGLRLRIGFARDCEIQKVYANLFPVAIPQALTANYKTKHQDFRRIFYGTPVSDNERLLVGELRSLIVLIKTVTFQARCSQSVASPFEAQTRRGFPQSGIDFFAPTDAAIDMP